MTRSDGNAASFRPRVYANSGLVTKPKPTGTKSRVEKSDALVIGGLTDEDAFAERPASFARKLPGSPAATVKFPKNLQRDKTRGNNVRLEYAACDLH